MPSIKDIPGSFVYIYIYYTINIYIYFYILTLILTIICPAVLHEPNTCVFQLLLVQYPMTSNWLKIGTMFFLVNNYLLQLTTIQNPFAAAYVHLLNPSLAANLIPALCLSPNPIFWHLNPHFPSLCVKINKVLRKPLVYHPFPQWNLPFWGLIPRFQTHQPTESWLIQYITSFITMKSQDMFTFPPH